MAGVGEQDAIGTDPTQLVGGASAAAGASAGARLEAGDKAGDYEVVRFIGAGAMGDVYEGVQPVIGKRVAIKVIKPALASSEEALARFTREARAVNKIDHPNVLDVFAYGQLPDGRLYLVMDLLEGQSLRAYLAERGALSLPEMLAILRPICEALAAAHDQHVVHRDLKPDNVFVAGGTGGGAPRVYVLDFGIAKFLHDEAASRGVETLTGEGAWIGTPLYMAPEQWSSEDVTPRSDIYALGVIAYQMIAGTTPYQAKSLPALMEKHFHAEVPALSTGSGPAVPEALDAAIKRALAKAPEDRFGSARELLAAVSAAVGGASVVGNVAAAAATARPSLRPFPAARPGGAGSRRRLVYAGLGVGVVAVAVAVGAIALRDDTGAAESNGPGTARPGNVLSVAVTSSPKGAVVYCNGRKFGVTPTTIEIEGGAHGLLRLTKPGYATFETEITRETHDIVSYDLQPITQFEGVWRRPDGVLRVFKRKGERIAGYEVSAVEDDPSFLHFFEFLPSDDPSAVVFGAVKDYVDDRADNEISCHIPLHAEYRYVPDGDQLELRLEEVHYDFRDGKCVNPAVSWGEFQALTRLAHASTRTRGTSTAGAGPTAVVPPAPVGNDVGLKQTPAQNQAPVQSKAPQTKSKQAPGKQPPGNKSPAKSKKQAPAKKSKLIPQGKQPPTRNAAAAPEPVPQQATPQAQTLPPPAN